MYALCMFPQMHHLIIRTCQLIVLLAWLLPPVMLVAAPVPDIQDPNAVTGRWLIKVADGVDPRSLAASAGAQYIRPLEGVRGYHRIQFLEQLQAGPDIDLTDQLARRLQAQSQILKFEKEELIVRYPKVFSPADPLFPEQWHHENTGQTGGLRNADIQVRPVWDQGYFGSGVVVGVIDTGIEYDHPDLIANWYAGKGYDYNDNDADPSPVGYDDRHGTSVAGITLADTNSIGGLGIAPAAKLVPLRLIAGPFSPGTEAEALSYQKDLVDIYNNSWGPSDDRGVHYAEINTVTIDALRDNVQFGRGGLGNIYVWAAGNGGLNRDNSNYDGYNALPYTISVGAVGQDDIKTGYSEPGANLLVVAPSGGRGSGITTTDNTGLSGYSSTDYFDNFSGTSAAAPMVSGVVALMLDARPDLNWRDVQQILAKTATPVDFSGEKWSRNAANLWVSHDYGFGRVNADAAVALAKNWVSLGAMQTATANNYANQYLQQGQEYMRQVSISSTMEVQFARVKLVLSHSNWGDIRVELESPSGMRSVLAVPHTNANTPGEPGTWTYLSTHFLGEPATGTWRLYVTDASSGGTGTWSSWTLELLGRNKPTFGNRDPSGDDLVRQSVEYPIEIDVFDGMSDADGDAVHILSIQQPRFGSISDLGGGRFAYTMGETKDGTDVFSVLFADGMGGVFRRMIRILDPRPICRADLYPVQRGATINLPVLSNDYDPDGDPLRIVDMFGQDRDYLSVTNGNTVAVTTNGQTPAVLNLHYTVTDDSDGIDSNWVTLVVQDSPDIAINFDGEDDYLMLPKTNQLQMSDKFTFEAWIYPESYGEYVTGFGRICDRDTFVFFLNGLDHSFYNDRSLVLYMQTSGGSYAINTGANTIKLNQWQHVAVSYDSFSSSPVKMYIDGQAVSVYYPSEVSSARPTAPISDNTPWPLYIGESDSGSRAFRGKMSEIRIWDRVQSSFSISSNYQRRMTGDEFGLKLYLPFTETLEPYAISTGSYKGTLEIYEAQRMPFNLASVDLRSNLEITAAFGQGWVEDKTLGLLNGNFYPWLYHESLRWFYFPWHTDATDYWMYFQSNNWGWMSTSESSFPWFNRKSDEQWLWFDERTAQPALFYDPMSSGWITY